MNKKAIVAIIKKNLLSVICGVVALLALISLLYPLSGMYGGFQTSLDGQKKLLDKAKSLQGSPRFLPVVQPGPNAERQKLTVFPNKGVIDEGDRARLKVQKQSEELTALAQEISKRGHDLLLPGSLPVPGDKLYDFVKAYKNAVLIPAAGQSVDAANMTNIPKLLGSVMPPDADEVNAVAQQIHDKDFEPRIVSVGGQEVNRKQIEAEFQARITNLADELRAQRAAHYQLYMDRTALSTSGAVLESSVPKAPEVWYAQLALWIENDIADSIINTNRDANLGDGGSIKPPAPNILNDPIKRLVHLDIPMGPSVFVMDDAALVAAGTTGGPAGGARPDVKTGGETGLPRDYTKSPTGRTCNSKYVVCRFSLIMEVDQRQVPLILNELQRNKLITVTDMNLVPVDNSAALDAGFVYGNAPMVELTLSCEEIFMKETIMNKAEDRLWVPTDVAMMLQWDEPATPKK